MQPSPCDVTAYHAYNGSEIALSKMQNIASSITGCLCLRKKYKIIKFHTTQIFIFTKKKKKKMIFATKAAPFNIIHMH